MQPSQINRYTFVMASQSHNSLPVSAYIYIYICACVGKSWPMVLRFLPPVVVFNGHALDIANAYILLQSVTCSAEN